MKLSPFVKPFLAMLLGLALLAGVFVILPAGNKAQAAPAQTFTVTTPVITVSGGITNVTALQRYLVTGTGFISGENVDITLRPNGAAAGVRLLLIRAASDGTISGTVTVPGNLAYGAYEIRAAGRSYDGQTVTLNPYLSSNLTGGAVGTPFAVSGIGWGNGETISLTFTSSPACVGGSDLGAATASRLGSFIKNTTVPTVTDGTYYVCGYGVTSTKTISW